MSSPATTFETLREQFSPGVALIAKMIGTGAVETSAEGSVVTLSDGRELLDFGSYGVTLLGHRHPAVLAAINAALERMPTATRVLANPSVAGFAAALSRRCGADLRQVWLGCDGSDAVEVSIKLARRASGRSRLLAVKGAFHGKTLGALSLTANPVFRRGLEPLLSNVSWLRRDDFEGVRRETARGDVAAVIFEPVQGEAGVRPLDPKLLHRWVDDAHAAGAFAISDEVQAGLGRCGPFSPSISHGLKPDAVLLGKALGGGLLPLSAVVATKSLAAPLIADPTWHSATFGGHPLACAAGSAALAALEAEAPNAIGIERELSIGLKTLTHKHAEVIIEVRGSGLLWGVQLASPVAAGEMLLGVAHRGLLVSPCLSSSDTIRLMPPMVATKSQVESALAIIDETAAELTGDH